MTTRHQDLMDKSLQCIHLARAISDRYDDPTKMPAGELGQQKSLLGEAFRLKELAEAAKQQADLESWAAKPDDDGQVLQSSAAHAQAVAVGSDGADPMAAASGRIAMQRFAKAVRSGKQALTLEEKAALVEDATGEVIVPPDLAGPIFKTLPHLGVFRGIGPLVRNTTSDRVSLRSLTGATAAWNKLELSGVPTTAAIIPNTPADSVPVWDLLALSQIGVDELADTDANIVALIQDIIGQVFAQLEDDAFAFGSGTSQPWGLAARATSGLITQGATAATNATIVPDTLKSLPFQVASRFQNNGVYMASRDATQAVTLLKDSTSNYLWQPSNTAGQPGTLFGYRFYTLEGLPAMTATTTMTDPSIMFGDVGNGYLLAQRQQITMQRLDERYADQGLVGFLFRMRVGGDVMRPAAFAKYLL